MSFLLLTLFTNGQGNVGIGTITPTEKLDINGNLRLSGEIKPDGNSGAPGQSLQSKGDGTMQWVENVSATGGVGFGTWGDCDMPNVTEYDPVSDPDGATNDFAGYSVSISGDYAIVGAVGDVEAGIRQGSARIYKRNNITGTWEPQGAKLLNPGGSAFDNFGCSVSISGDYAIVGANQDDDAGGVDQGSACIFKRNSSSEEWELQGSKLFNPGAAENDQFGTSVSISGDYAIVGAPNDGDVAVTYQGSASIFKRNSSSGEWELQGTKLFNPGAAADDSFGTSVSISGDYAIVGAPYDTDFLGSYQGTATIFKRNSSTGYWEPQGAKLLNPGSALQDVFGYSVCISGDYVIIGAPYDSESASYQGSACIFKRTPSTENWVAQGAKLLNPGAASDDYFGSSVSISGNYAIVGAYQDDDTAGAEQGSATIFVNTGFIWQRIQKMTDPAGNISDEFGSSCAIDGSTKRFIVGVKQAAGYAGKVVFGKVK